MAPGKYEAAADPELAEQLHRDSLDAGCQDERSVGDDWYGLMNQYVLREDSQGFFTYDEHDSAEAAREAFDAIGARA